MEKIFQIKNNLPYEFENFRSNIEGETVQRIQFDLTQEITLDIATDLQNFFGNYFQEFSTSIDFDRKNITIQRR